LLLYSGHFYTLYLLGRLRSEHLFMPLSLAAILFLKRFEASHSTRSFWLGMALSILAAFARTVGWVIPACFILNLLRKRDWRSFWLTLGTTLTGFVLYLLITDTGNYFYQIDQVHLGKGRPRWLTMMGDVCVHFGRNTIDFISGFWTVGVSYSTAGEVPFLFKLAAGLLISVVIYYGAWYKLRKDKGSIREMYFLAYPIVFWAFGFYADMYRYFYPILPLCFYFMDITLSEKIGIARNRINGMYCLILLIYLARAIDALGQPRVFYS